jgi:murein DD-endopeptidase MepM/ murein hydrolase activator NlpD
MEIIMKRKQIIVGLIILLIPISTYASVAFPISSGFGWRIDPFTHLKTFHTGIDIPKEAGSPIFAIFNGDVIIAGRYRGYGIAILLHHSDNRYTLYGHCSAVLVSPGQNVKAGTKIGLVGSTGISTGPHLHLEYWVHGQYQNPLTIWESENTKKW